MKTLKLGFALFFGLLVIANTGCTPKKSQKTRISSRLVRGGTADGVTTGATATGASANRLWGAVVRQNLTQQQFQQNILGLVSNMAEEDGTVIQVGVVSGDANAATGVRFWGDVHLVQGLLNRQGSNNAQVNSTNSRIRISIIDQAVVDTGGTTPEIPIYIAAEVEGFVGVSGTVTNNTADIIFRDQYGLIRLQGSFTADWFTGTMSFANVSSVLNPSVGANGALGVFYVPTCGFFNCQ